jgi:hypothetical protein
MTADPAELLATPQGLGRVEGTQIEGWMAHKLRRKVSTSSAASFSWVS